MPGHDGTQHHSEYQGSAQSSQASERMQKAGHGPPSRFVVAVRVETPHRPSHTGGGADKEGALAASRWSWILPLSRDGSAAAESPPFARGAARGEWSRLPRRTK